MTYWRFFAMILTSTIVMFALMYLNTYALEHVFFSETRSYMAIYMGAAMAVIMLAYMLGMYSNKGLNIAIFAGSIIIFGLALWLVRSQVTVSGESYMRAMIPHHSIAIMTSERAQIEDPRVRKMADEIIAAQRREIAEMRALIAAVDAGDGAEDIYQDPAAAPGTVQEALSNTLISRLDLAPMTADEAAQVLGATPVCSFVPTEGSDPFLWVAGDGSAAAAAKLNGVLLSLDGAQADPGVLTYAAPGATVTILKVGDAAGWRADAELIFELDQGLRVAYRGFSDCAA